MTNALYVIIITVSLAVQNIAKKPYTEKTNGKGVYFFTAAASFFAMLFFALTSGKPSFCTEYLPYSLLFALFYCMTTVFTVLAVSSGSLSLTSLFISYSLMLPTLYGLIFLKDPVSRGFIPGIILLIVSLLLINGKNDSGKISFKWIIKVITAVVTNGLCALVQNAEQRHLGGMYKSEFMTAALLIVTVVMALASLLKEKQELRAYIKSGWIFGMITGIMNGVSNLFVMLASAKMSISLLFPLVSAGGIITTYAVSRFLYKEKLSPQQLAGLLIGICSVALLNF